MGNRESGVGNRESGIGSGESGNGSWESRVESRESGVGSRESGLESWCSCFVDASPLRTTDFQSGDSCISLLARHSVRRTSSPSPRTSRCKHNSPRHKTSPRSLRFDKAIERFRADAEERHPPRQLGWKRSRRDHLRQQAFDQFAVLDDLDWTRAEGEQLFVGIDAELMVDGE